MAETVGARTNGMKAAEIVGSEKMARDRAQPRSGSHTKSLNAL